MTIKDIAKESGYAVSTVSRVLNNKPDVSQKTRDAVMAVVKAHNFTPNNNAKHLKQQAAANIAILVKGTSNMLFASIVEQLQALIKKASLLASVHYLDEDTNEVEQAIQLCRERKPLGLLFLGGNIRFFEAGFRHIAIPSVLVTNTADSISFDNLSSVSTDDIAGAACAIRFLAEHGHRKIGILGGDPQNSYTSWLRYQGCLECFREQSIPFDEATQYQKARFSFQSAYKATGKLLAKTRDLTALFAMSDVMAIGAIRALQDEAIRVPKDISVIGYDGIELAEYYNPKLTTIKQSQDRLAQRSVEILLRAIESHGLQKNAAALHEIVAFGLIRGESVRRIG